MKLLVETEDYTLIPVEGHAQAWDVRLETGPYPETVIRFGPISLDGKTTDDVIMHYRFDIMSTPAEGLTTDDIDLQEFVGDVLFTIVRGGIEDGTLLAKERNIQ